MSLSKLIRNIQNKPFFIRVQIMWVMVIFCMTIVFFLWLAGLKDISTNSAELSGSSGSDKKESLNMPSFWGSMGSSFKTLMDETDEEFNSVPSTEKDGIFDNQWEGGKLPE